MARNSEDAAKFFLVLVLVLSREATVLAIDYEYRCAERDTKISSD